MAPREALAHGGLPVSHQIMHRNGELLVTAPFWGIFVGREGGDWRWICDEAIGTDIQPRLALSSDGMTIYATDRSGMTISTDGGCNWVSVPGAIADLDIVDIVTDPVQPMRAYALANGLQNSSQTGVWKTEDRGQSWTLHVSLNMQLPVGLAISADGQKVAATSVSSTIPRSATLYEAGPTGSAQSRVLTFVLDGQSLAGAIPLLYEGTALYLRTETDTSYGLHRLDDAVSTTPARLLKTNVSINGLARAPQGNALLVGTYDGIYQQQSDQTFSRLSTLSGSWCLSRQGSSLYSCASNYAPDLAAVAKLGPDLTTFSKVFRFADTKGPISCPATSSVGKICSDIWASYVDQLSDAPITNPPPVGTDMGSTAPAMPASGCAVGRESGGGVTPVSALGLLASIGLLAAWRRRRAANTTSLHRT